MTFDDAVAASILGGDKAIGDMVFTGITSRTACTSSASTITKPLDIDALLALADAIKPPPLPPEDKCICCGGVGVFKQNRVPVSAGTSIYSSPIGNVCSPCFELLKTTFPPKLSP